MNIALMENTLCINIKVFDSIKKAQEFLDAGLLPRNITSVSELPDGFGIGDFINENGEWEKAYTQLGADSPFAPDEAEFLQGFVEGYTKEAADE